ncbi:MAG: MFS transporter [Dehalococcoidia bacterium]|nr:MFS transporter [Dehalococcoidia bacterium]HRC62036.1 MFS transporter [Dehalococcoidia bacterium]
MAVTVLRRLRSSSEHRFYGWNIVAAGAVNNFLTAGLAVWGFGVYVSPLREEFGWSTAAIAAGFSIRSFQQGFLAPLAGIIVDRFGPRQVAVVGSLLMVAGLLLFASTQSLWMYYLASVLMAMGQSASSFTAFSTAVMRWFARKRGRAMGTMHAGNGAGYFLVPGVAFIVAVGGWREALVISAVLVLVIALPLALVLRNSPSDLGLAPDGDAPLPRADSTATVNAAGLSGSSLGEAMHTSTFWLIALAQACGGASVQGWVVHTIPHLENVGFSLGAATMIGVGYAVCQLIFRPATGLIADRVGRKRIFVISFLLQSVGMLAFASLSSERFWLLPVYYATFAAGQAAWVVLQAAIVADYFGPRRFATINGVVNTIQMPVGVISPIAAGYVFDHAGSYAPVFIVYSGMSIVAAGSILLIRRQTWGARAETLPAAA